MDIKAKKGAKPISILFNVIRENYFEIGIEDNREIDQQKNVTSVSHIGCQTF
jgi:hypothetical protein